MSDGVHARVRVLGRESILRPGQVIGRGAAGLTVEHPDVSEAHALCSWRDDGLVLFPLRGLLRVGQARQTRVVLTPGVCVTLADGVVLEVIDVQWAEQQLFVRLGAATFPVPRASVALVAAPEVELVPDDDPEGALLRLWVTDGEHFLQLPGGGPERVTGPRSVEVAGRVVELWFERATEPTSRSLFLELAPDRCSIRRGNTPVFSSKDEHRVNLLRRLFELTRTEAEVHWQELAILVWGEDAFVRHAKSSDHGFRKMYDMEIKRLRDSLNKAGLPDVLERPTTGYVAFATAHYTVLPRP